MKNGIPIALGYLAVSFTLGIAAKNAGLGAGAAAFMSVTNLTSAGEFAALSLILAKASYVEMAFTQLIINLRYSLMSCALSQKFAAEMKFYHRFFAAFAITDEIFGVAASEKRLNPFYIYGMAFLAIPAWTFGTYLGVVSGELLSDRLLSAMGVALYGMFIAVIMPAAKNDKVLRILVPLAMLASFLMEKLPYTADISGGFKIIILTIVMAGAAAVLFPKDEKNESAEKNNLAEKE